MSSAVSGGHRTCFVALVALCVAVFVLFTMAGSGSLQFAFGESDGHSVPEIFDHRLVHLDLKGAPPRFEFLQKLFPFFRRLGFRGLLVEWEDMFPYTDTLANLSLPYAYDSSTVHRILALAAENDLEVVPLVQTFGHMEFVLKHPAFATLREVPERADTICPSDNRSIAVIQELLRQVRRLHPNARTIHIGCDEAWSIAKDDRCQRRLHTEFDMNVDRLKLAHISSIARFAKQELRFENVLAWNDLFDKVPVPLLKEAEMGELVVPVVWGYATNVTTYGYFPPGMFERYSQVFGRLAFGSVFKGANGQNQTFIDVDRYLRNLQSYLTLYREQKPFLANRLHTTIMTGWQRFWHGAGLCELMPEGIPALVRAAVFMNDSSLDAKEVTEGALNFLGCPRTSFQVPTRKETIFTHCLFPGSEAFVLIEQLYVLREEASHTAFSTRPPSATFVKRVSDLREALRKALGALYFPDTVEEFLRQNVHPLLPAQ